GLFGGKPRSRERIFLEESQQHRGDFLAAAWARMSAVAGKILTFPYQAVRLARRRAVGPEVRTPEKQWRFHRALLHITIKRGIPFDLIADQPTHNECRLVREWFRIQSRVRMARVDTAAEISDAQIRETRLSILDNGQRVLLQFFAVIGKVAGRSLV